MRSRRWLAYGGAAALLAVSTVAAAVLYLQEQGVAPRALAPYVEKRSSGHNPAIEQAGRWSQQALTALDRGAAQPHVLLPLLVGAQPAGRAAAPGRNVLVADSDAVRAAIAHAQPGDVITLVAGTYRFNSPGVKVNQPGSAAARITLRAERPGTVLVEFNTTEGFAVSAPYWSFENLSIRGACARHDDCEHAFHVVGGAQHFAAINNTVADFNAHFKINANDGRFPDHGLIDGNTLTNASARDTRRPVTPIDLVTASDWTIRRNLITDFIKLGGDKISYGAFAKGAGSDNVFEQNVVLCEHRLARLGGQRVGLSLGGGGTGKQYCRDHRCITEQDGGVIRANLIASCSDDGIYLNSASRSKVLHNTLVDTGGVSVRFPESSADIEGNLVDGAIRSRNGGALHLADNLQTPIAQLYLGYHPVRALFKAPETLDFSWAGEAPRRRAAEALPNDLCGAARSGGARYGAFEDFSACLAPLGSR
jgi:hypothetical protein